MKIADGGKSFSVTPVDRDGRMEITFHKKTKLKVNFVLKRCLALVLLLLYLTHLVMTSHQEGCPGGCSCGYFAAPIANTPVRFWSSVLLSTLATDSKTRQDHSSNHSSTSLVKYLLMHSDNANISDASGNWQSLDDAGDDVDKRFGEVGAKPNGNWTGNALSVNLIPKAFPESPALSLLQRGFQSPASKELLKGLSVTEDEAYVSCADSHIQSVPPAPSIAISPGFAPDRVVKLDLSGNFISSLASAQFQPFTRLRFLILDHNEVAVISDLRLPPTVLFVSIADNQLTTFPSALQSARSLKILNLAGNHIRVLRDGSFSGMSSLIILSFHQNQIYHIEDASLYPLRNLMILDLADNRLTSVPKAVRSCRRLRQLLLADNRMPYVGEDAFQGMVGLEWVDLQGNPLSTVHPHTFSNLPSLTKLILESTRDMETFPYLNGSAQVQLIRLERGTLLSVPGTLCQHLAHLKSLNLHLNKIENLPDLASCSSLRLLDLSNNKLSTIGEGNFLNLRFLQDLLLQYNHIQHISKEAFAGLKSLQVLNLEFNQISTIDNDAFLPLVSLEDINLGNNMFSVLPSSGLEQIISIKVHNNANLRKFPGPENFPLVHRLVLSYAYHCCPFISAQSRTFNGSGGTIQETVVYDFRDLPTLSHSEWNISSVWPHVEGYQTAEFHSIWNNPDDATSPAGPAEWGRQYPGPELNEAGLSSTRKSSLDALFPPRQIECIPQPGPFMPCRDLFDWWTLRCGVWLVFLLALMGNGVVVIVLVSAYSKMDVPRFLVSNLALADFFMGIYLGFLAVVDASTLGEFRMYAIPWQMSVGCQLAGFLGVLSSELSVYTLTVITLERNYAITHAIRLNKRLSLRHATYVMAVGWVFSLTVAILPLAGISDYRKFAVCLPFETAGLGLGYVVFIMLINGVAFLILMGCYLKIYCAIKGSQAWNSNDSRIAKRMGLLVFTDFICWAPIAFFSLSAIYGWQLISLEGAKVFTVFVLPFNSCCNPFLYALLTKQFKKDCVLLCKAIEESRVTRGIGRCRHSSNFSNRQTPANTNSALDQTSKEEHLNCGCRSKDQQDKINPVAARMLRLFCCHSNRKPPTSHVRSDQIRTSSRIVGASTVGVGTSENPWSWRGQTASALRLLELRRQATLDLTRKSSHESSLSSSRNDSSGNSNSTVTWRVSRSSVSSDTSNGCPKGQKDSVRRCGSIKENSDEMEPGVKDKPTVCLPSGPQGGSKPKLLRQGAVENDSLNTLRCPFHTRVDNLSCVYEQVSLEEEDSNEVFSANASVCLTHKRSLSDGLLCGTLLSISAPAPQLVPLLPSPKANVAVVAETRAKDHSTSSEVRTEETDEEPISSEDSRPKEFLETHFPVDEPLEVHPLI